MSKITLSHQLAQSQQLLKLQDAIAQNHRNIHAKGLIGSALSYTISAVFEDIERPILLILNDKEEAAYYLNDLEQLRKEVNVLF